MSNLKWILIVIISFLLFSFFVFKKNKQSGGSEKNILTIAIFKTASHPSLNEAEKGFLDGLKIINPKTEVNIVYYNAEGIMINAHAIAQEIAADKKITAFYTIGSLSTQTLSFIEQKRPIIFSAVSNPKKLLNPKENNQNICGISDSVATVDIVDFIKKTVPLAKKIGILRSSQAFNENECAAIAIDLEKNGVVVEHLVISQESDIDSLLKSYKVSQLDAIFSPADNLIASSICRIADILAKQKIPFLTSFYDENVFSSIGKSYYEIGYEAAENLKMIIEDKKLPKDIGFSSLKMNTIFVNKTIAFV
jgi:putative ABC transport system substrate-binding protein